MIQFQLFPKIDHTERDRLFKRGLNYRSQMEACNWPITLKSIIGFLEAQTNKYHDELKQIKWDLEQIAIDILNCD
jgi:hypothetical protein